MMMILRPPLSRKQNSARGPRVLFSTNQFLTLRYEVRIIFITRTYRIFYPSRNFISYRSTKHHKNKIRERVEERIIFYSIYLSLISSKSIVVVFNNSFINLSIIIINHQPPITNHHHRYQSISIKHAIFYFETEIEGKYDETILLSSSLGFLQRLYTINNFEIQNTN